MTALPPQRLFADISDYQGSFDAGRYARSGRKVVMIKHGEGGGNAGGEHAAARVEQAHRVGLHVIHYLMAIYDEAPADSLANYCERIRPRWHAGDRMELDIEAYSGPPDRAAGWVRDAQKYLRQVQKATNPAMIYTNESYMLEAGPQLWNLTSWWHIAAYDGSLQEPRLPRGCKAQLLAKQYTDGEVGAEPRITPGVGACDQSILTSAGAAYLQAPTMRLKRRRLTA